ncbi:MAG TPA: arginine--tRNA ligase [Stellaceae bacterium]|nr:arginine--tRNA ligase [Stellaceae bacterium]
MNLFSHFGDVVAGEIAALVAQGAVPSDLDTSRIAVEPPRDPAHGDISTNAAMVLAKPAGMAPRALAALLIDRLKAQPDVIGAEIAGPGFINLRLADRFWHERLADILRAGAAYGDSALGADKPVNVEYVSANPTGPMHVGHGRGAVFGDALAALLEKTGFRVAREYYINDAGAQVDMLARSLYLRYREALGDDIGTIPEGLYPGDYLKETGRALAARDGTKWTNAPERVWLPVLRDFAVAEMMVLIRGDLAALGVRHDVFSSERAIVEAGGIALAVEALQAKGLVYTGTLEPPKGKLPVDWEARPQLLFRSTEFGDDVDRPLQKSDGSWTYFAADIAYHLDKYRRGFPDLIDVWGADHGGYVKRVQAAVKALSGGRAALDVKLCQLVNLFDKGVPVRMSKRAGTFVTLREAVDEVGKDVFRFVMLTRRNDQPLDFDFAKVVEQSKDNPVFYVQYAHARARSVLRLAADSVGGDTIRGAALASAPLARLTDPAELALIRHLAGWPRLVETAAESHEPHRIAFYLQELAAAFHGLWNKGKDDASLRFILSDAPELTLARLALVQAVAHVVASGLSVFGVAPVEEMR